MISNAKLKRLEKQCKNREISNKPKIFIKGDDESEWDAIMRLELDPNKAEGIIFITELMRGCNMNIQNRLKKLEELSQPDLSEPLIIFRKIVGSDNGRRVDLPILGWRIEGYEDVMRLPEETEDCLLDRVRVVALTHASGKNVISVAHIFEA